jgi:hypothetical protein
MRGGITAHTAHLWHRTAKAAADGPLCGARIKRHRTARIAQPIRTERLCYDCLASGAAGHDR